MREVLPQFEPVSFVKLLKFRVPYCNIQDVSKYRIQPDLRLQSWVEFILGSLRVEEETVHVFIGLTTQPTD